MVQTRLLNGGVVVIKKSPRSLLYLPRKAATAIGTDGDAGTDWAVHLNEALELWQCSPGEQVALRIWAI